MGLWSLMNVEVVATVILVAAWRACVATSTQTHAALSTQSLAFSSTEVFASSTQPPTASSTESLVALSILELVASSTQAHAASPVTLPPQNTDFLNFTLRKCRCEKNNVLDGSVCRKKSTEVVVYNPANKTSVWVKTSDFSSVRIEDVKCGNGTERVTLNIATNDFVLFAGQMVWVDGSKVLGEYCIEHLVRGEELHQVAHICLPPPHVPQCCPPGHLLAPDDSCVPSSNRHTFAPPILFNNDLVPWKDVDGNVKNVTCDGIPVVRRLYLNTQEGELMYSVSGTLLRWTPLFWPDQKQFEQNYCVGMELDKNNDAQYIAKFCYVDLVKHHQLTCSNNTCVRKCCAKNEIILIPQCIMAAQVEEIWEPSFHILQEKLTSVKLAAEKWTLVTGNPLCSTFYQLDPLRIDDDKFYLLENGSLHIPKHQTSYPSTHYCVDSFLTENGTIMEGAMLCTNEDTCSWKTIVDVVLLGISCVFLAITLGVYMGVAELRDRTYGRCLISMVAAMLSTYITLIINNQVREQSDTQCIIRGGNRRSKKWHHRSVCYLEELHLLEQARELLPVERLPPWEDDSCKIIINEMATKKSNMLPQEMRHKYLEEIYKEAGDELDQIYTDGSSNPVNGRAGAACTVIKDNTFQRRNEEKARIENYASSTQAELTAIVMALRFLERNTNGVVICTDSKTALQSLSKNRAENLAIVAEIKRAVRVLTNQGRVVKFLWIPSHGIHRNGSTFPHMGSSHMWE
ncbi:uncharacterized protein [Procambarus clarkii]|uniref:uncharacterized protein isoform X5 n=1 Tax=Procambarus clarkii TaxID=6728 RepID=UPI0037440EB5